MHFHLGEADTRAFVTEGDLILSSFSKHLYSYHFLNYYVFVICPRSYSLFDTLLYSFYSRNSSYLQLLLHLCLTPSSFQQKYSLPSSLSLLPCSPCLFPRFLDSMFFLLFPLLSFILPSLPVATLLPLFLSVRSSPLSLLSKRF